MKSIVFAKNEYQRQLKDLKYFKGHFIPYLTWQKSINALNKIEF